MNNGLNIQYSADRILHFLRMKKNNFWSHERKTRPLKLFHAAAQRVPAYKDFLKKNGIKHELIRTWEDFQLVPMVSKKSYLRQYPLEQLVWDGHLAKSLVYTSTSGSTGEPFYFPRSERLDWEYSILVEMFLQNSSVRIEDPTLVIIGFGMGVWIGGLITYKAFEMVSHRGYPLSIITPGINKLEIIYALKNLAPHYVQTVLIGYPPFIKDVLDEAGFQGINLKQLNIRLLFAAESFTEKFRDYVIEKGSVRNEYRDTLNIYGTADIGAMAWETPVSILIRRIATQNKNIFRKIFRNVHKTPTLAQYNPFFITFEECNDEILLTGNNTIPLIRYAVGDHGGVLDYRDISTIFDGQGLSLKNWIHKSNIPVTEMPFVYVYERNDFSTTLYGLQIYPEPIREAIIDRSIQRFVTGKFTMLTKFNKKQDQYLEIHLELKKGKTITKRMQKEILHKIVIHLRHKNSEFRELSNQLKERAYPHLVFWPAEDPVHFRPGVKQKWVKKQ